MAALWAVVCGLFGLAVGSFLNVVIWRIPRDESIVRPASRCPACGHTLSAAENVPVASWLALRGRCRACGVRISIRYPFVELATAFTWAATGARFADVPWAIPAYLVLAASLIALSVIDLDTLLLPNRIVYPTGFAMLGLLAVASWGEDRWDAYPRALGGAAVYFGAYYVLWFVVGGRALGFGDVRLAAVLGLALGWLGWAYLGWGMFLPFALGSLAGMVVVAPWIAAPMVTAGLVGALFAVEIVDAWTGSEVSDPAAARITVGALAALLTGAIVFVVASLLRRVPRGRALPFGPSMAAGCLAIVLAGGALGL